MNAYLLFGEVEQPAVQSVFNPSLMYGLIFLAIAVFIVEAFIIIKTVTPWGASDIQRLLGLTIIVFGSLVVVSSGRSMNELAPIMGLLGTALGYLLKT